MLTFVDACPLGFADVRGSVCQGGGSDLHDDWVWRLCLSQAFSILPWVEDHREVWRGVVAEMVVVTKVMKKKLLAMEELNENI